MAKFNVGDKVKAKDPKWVGYQGSALGHDVYTVKKVDWDGTVKLDGFLDLWISPDSLVAANSRACNARFKAGDKAYVHWLSGEDELVDVISYEPKGDYYIVRGEDGQLAHPKASLLYPVKNASALNAVRVGMKDTNGRDISIGDSIQHIDSKMKGKVVGKFNEHLLLVDWDGGFQEEVHPSDIRITNSRACNSTNPIVRKAMNAQYEYHTYLVPVIRKGKKDYVTIFRVADEETAKKLVDVPSYRNIGVTVDETRPVKVAKNAKALNFSPGDKVSIVDTDIRYGGDKGEVVRKDGFRYVVRLTTRQDKPEVTLQPNQLKAANSEDAQGHEHGSDGKFTSKGGGSDGGDSYEDPKTKRMKERLAKMREKNEALRKEIDQRKAALAGKKAETEKMRADVMKANVEKWKAGLPKTKNAIVARALNAATARNFTPTSEFEVGDKVRFRDSVRSVPHDETYTVVKVSGKNITIKGGRDGGTSVEFANNLEPVFNAATARNADNPHDIDAHGKKLVKGDWVRFLKDMPDVKRGECAVVKYALPGGLIFSTLAGAREISWDASVVEKMPPIPMSLSQIDAWKKGPRA